MEEFKIRLGEDWKKDFVEKLNGDRPLRDKSKCNFGDANICTRFHLCSDCFENCHNAASHKPKDKISSDRKGP